MEGIKGVFQIEVAGSKADSNYQPGQIIEQDPKSGHVRKNNLKITVWICAKEETNLMVNVLGEDVQDAKVELTNLNLNLNVQIREVYSDEYAAGKGISSTPAAARSVSHTFTGDKGTSITVYLYINGTEVASQVVSF